MSHCLTKFILSLSFTDISDLIGEKALEVMSMELFNYSKCRNTPIHVYSNTGAGYADGFYINVDQHLIDADYIQMLTDHEEYGILLFLDYIQQYNHLNYDLIHISNRMNKVNP